MKLFLLMGQSNMSGRGTIEAQDLPPHPRIWMMNASQQWVPAAHPVHYDPDAALGLCIDFAKTLTAADANVEIGLIPCAVGGTALSTWMPGTTLYNNAVARATAAAGNGTLAGVLWHQGEADSSYPQLVATYVSRFTAMITQLRTDLNAPLLPVIVGELANTNGSKNEFHTIAIHPIPDALPKSWWVSSAGLTADGSHFDAASLRLLGTRYAAAYVSLYDYTAPQPDPAAWATPPTAAADSAITMTAAIATDPNGVEYFFTNTSIPGGSHDSGWQTSPTFIATGLASANSYTYTVRVRDKSPNRNMTAVSAPASATTFIQGYWDANGTTAGAGATPTGTWGTSSFWNTDATGGAGGVFQNTTTGSDDLYFVAGQGASSGQSSYNVTVSGTQWANSLTFRASGTTNLIGVNAATFNITLGAGGITMNETAYGTTPQGGVIIGDTGTANTLTLAASQTWLNNAANQIELRPTLTTVHLGTNTLTVAGSGMVTMSDLTVLSGSGGLVKNGRGTLVLSAANTAFTGPVTLHAGTLRVTGGNGSSLGAGAATLNITGGMLDLQGDTAQAYDRPTTVTGDATIVAGRNVAGAGVLHTFDTLGIGGHMLHALGGNITSGTAGLTYTAATLGGTPTFDVVNPTAGGVTQLTLGAVGDGGGGYGLVKTGTGTLITGSNTYGGPTTIEAGVFQLGTLGGSGRNLTVSGGATVACSSAISNALLNRFVENSNGITIALAAASGNALDFNTSAGAILPNASLGATDTFTYSGTLTPNGTTFRLGGGGGALTVASALTGAGNSLVVSGGPVTLSNANDFSGATTLNGTTLTVSGPSGAINDSSAIGISHGGTLILANTSTANHGNRVRNNAPITVTNGGNLSFTHNAGAASYSERVGTLTVNSGNFRFATSNSAAGQTNEFHFAGTPTLGATATVDFGTQVTYGVAAGTAGARVFFDGQSATAAGDWLGPQYTVNGTPVAYGANGIVAASGFATLSDTSDDPAVTYETPASPVTMATSGTYKWNGLNFGGTGIAVDLNGSLVKIVSGGMTGGNGANVISNGTLTSGSTSSVPMFLSPSNGNGSQITVNATIADNPGGGALTLVRGGSPAAQGNGSAGIFLVILGGANTYTGDTLINSGGLALTNPLALQNSTLDFRSTGSNTGLAFGTETVNLTSATFGGLKGDKNLPLMSAYGTLQPVALSVGGNGQSTTYSGILNGTGSLTKTGTGTLTLSGANTHTGTTTVTAGTLVAASAAALGDVAAGTTVASGATLDVQANTGTEAVGVEGTGVGGAGALVAGAGTGTVGGAVTLNADTTVGGAGTLHIDGAVGGGFHLTKVGAGTTHFGAAGSLSGVGDLTVGDGTTNVNSAVGGGTSAVRVGPVTPATLRFGSVSQKLGSLSIGAGSTVVFTSGPAAFTSGFGGWAAGFSLTGNDAAADADPDRDGIANAIEYVLGASPVVAGDAALPVATVVDGNLVFAFHRAVASKTAGVTVTVDVGTTLGTWPDVYQVGSDTASSSPGIVITAGAPGFETITLIVPVAADTRKFARMRVTVLPP